MSVLKNYKFTIALLLGVLIGGVSGILFGEKTIIVKPIGDVFLNLIFALIVPLVFFSVSSAICNMKQSNMVGKIIRNIVFAFLFTSIVIAAITYLVTLFYNPLKGIDTSVILQNLPKQTDIKQLSSAQMFVNIFTVSDFQVLLTKSNLLPLIIFSVIFGLATYMIGEKGKLINNFINAATDVILKMMTIIMKVAPIGLGCYFAYTVGQLGSQILSGYLHVFILYLILTIISYFGLNSLYVFLAGGKNCFIQYWKNIITPSFTAIATSSSAACIPVNIQASEAIGVPANIAETVIPLGTNMHKDGSIIGGVLKIVFLFTLFGEELTSSGNIFLVIGIALLVGAVMGAIPSGGMTGELLICSVFGFPPELAATLMIISTIIDIPATLLNSTGNVVSSILVTRMSLGKNWFKQAQSLE